MRHAKSDWGAEYDSDHERPLNDRGVRSAQAIGRVLSAEGIVPELVVTSTAVRAYTTARLANEAGNWGSEIVLDPTLYGSGADAAVQAAAAAPDVSRLMLVGHEPTWSSLVSVLSGEKVDMKTGTVAVLEFDIEDWSMLPSRQGKVTAVHRPREYFGGGFDRE